MKKQFKGFILGVIVATLLMSTAFGASVTKSIEVMLNSVNLKVNGKDVQADNILYEGTTYVPLRAISEMLGKEVGWDQETKTASINDQVTEKTKQEPVEEPGKLTVEQLPYDINMLSPDSIGNVWMEATYTNNSNYPITGFNVTVLLKDKNDKAYLSNYDTVMPGETSPIFETIGPNTRSMSDIEILKIEIRAEIPEGKTLSVDYDVKLNKYDYMEY